MERKGPVSNRKAMERPGDEPKGKDRRRRGRARIGGDESCNGKAEHGAESQRRSLARKRLQRSCTDCVERTSYGK